MRQKISGFSLIEVLVSLVILSLILLGADVMQITALKQDRAAYFFYLANNQIQSMEEHLKSLTPDEDLSSIIDIWNVQNKEILPQGKGEIRGHYPFYSISVYWGGKSTCDTIQTGQSGCLTTEIFLKKPQDLASLK